MGLVYDSPSDSNGPRIGIPRLSALFFMSGVSSLIFETVFVRLLSYTFGNTAQAVSTVLAAFLGGLALGAFFIGRWVDRRPASIWIYGILELLVGILCIFVPSAFQLLTQIYVSLHHVLHGGPATLTALRFALAFLVIFPPTALMGATLPALARYISAREPEYQPHVDRLYAWNVLGAAAGTLVSTYVLLPSLGVLGTVWIACALNIGIFGYVAKPAGRNRVVEERVERQARADASIPQPGQLSSQSSSQSSQSLGAQAAGVSVKTSWPVLLLGACLTGAAALSYEVIWTHIQAFTIGNTVYAFGVMLFAVLCGLGLGGQIVAQHIRRRELWASVLVASQLLLGFAVLLTLPLWGLVPKVFAHGPPAATFSSILGIAPLLVFRFAYLAWKRRRHPEDQPAQWRTNEPLFTAMAFFIFALVLSALAPTHPTVLFLSTELLRFLCVFWLLIIPAMLLGMSFPLLVNLACGSPHNAGSKVGALYASNTLGAVIGSVAAGFIVLPRLGSFAVLQGMAALNIALGLFFAFSLTKSSLPRKIALSGVALAAVFVFVRGQKSWDPRLVASGTYVYFQPFAPIDEVLYSQEDIEGGLTSVVRRGASTVMLSNGKFQGNNTEQVPAQSRFTLIPILFTHDFNRALVIGLGTGSTLHTVSLFPFRRIDAVELAPHVVEAAKLWFQDVNGGVLERDPRVELTLADGRNFLLLSRQRYDLITIEITSIWISGEGDLYNREFYELCRDRLTNRGILQQWVQIHHMSTVDLLVILNTAAQVFTHVAFFLGPQQGVLVASSAPLELDYAQIEAQDAEPGVRSELDRLELPSLSSLLGELMLYGNSLREALAFLPRLSNRPADFVSEDFFPYLEYHTPLGNVLPYDTAPANVRFLEKLRPALLPEELSITHVPSANERNLILGYIAAHRGDVAEATNYLEQVEGPARSRAQAELERIAAKRQSDHLSSER